MTEDNKIETAVGAGLISVIAGIFIAVDAVLALIFGKILIIGGVVVIFGALAFNSILKPDDKDKQE